MSAYRCVCALLLLSCSACLANPKPLPPAGPGEGGVKDATVSFDGSVIFDASPFDAGPSEAGSADATMFDAADGASANDASDSAILTEAGTTQNQ